MKSNSTILPIQSGRSRKGSENSEQPNPERRTLNVEYCKPQGKLVWSGAMDMWKYWMAFGVGVAAGAAVALLYAPQPGDRTRKQIKRGLEDATDRIQSTAEDISEKAEHYGKQAERVIRRGREAVDETLSKASSVANKVADFI
jgi:gas vesicle protein